MTRNSLLGRVLISAGICSFTVLGWAASPSDGQQAAAPSAGAVAAVVASADKSDNKATHHSDTPVAGPDGPPPAADDHWGFLNYYCSKCHNATDWAGGVAFDTMSSDSIPDEAETWENTVRKLRGQLMPPAGNRTPPAGMRKNFIAYMEGELDKAGQAHPQPGRVALHRLNRKEYANAVWDVLNVRADVNSMLPQDDAAEGFDNVANVLQVSPSFLDSVSRRRPRSRHPGGGRHRREADGHAVFRA